MVFEFFLDDVPVSVDLEKKGDKYSYVQHFYRKSDIVEADLSKRMAIQNLSKCSEGVCDPRP